MFVADYGQLDIHRLMVSDEVRTEAYRRALAAAVRPGDVVLDAGAGTGIMGILAALSGAKKVYCVEVSSIAEMARALVKQNGLEDRVEVIRGDVAQIALPEPVDVIVGEWMGCYGVDENLLSPLLVARDRWLKPGGRLLPETLSAWLAPVEDTRLAEEMDFWRAGAYGVDFSPMAQGFANEVRMGQHHLTAETALAPGQALWTTDVRTISVEEARLPFRATREFEIARCGQLSALAAWFEAVFPDGSVLTNAPEAPWTHWGRAVFPLYGRLPVTAGRPVQASLTCEPADPGYCHQRWSVKVGEGELEEHDTRKDATV